jgi:hypothetical protein
MHATRRELFKSSLAAAAAAALPSAKAQTHHGPAHTELRANMAKCDAAAALPVFKRELFPTPVIIASIELLHYQKSWLCRVRSKDGVEGISISNAQQMEVLYPLFVERIAPFFLGQDARDLEKLLEMVTVFNNNYKACSSATRSTTRRSPSIRRTASATSPRKRPSSICSAMSPSLTPRRSSSSWAAACRTWRRRRAAARS